MSVGSLIAATSSWGAFLSRHSSELLQRTGEHLLLAGASTLAAVALGVPLGILAVRQRWIRGPILGGVGVLQTIPSLAMLTVLLVVLGKIGMAPAIIALTLYALLPIVVNTVAGLEGVPDGTIEAATGIGMTPRQVMWMVRIPLALPVIIAGIRTAAVIGVGIATLSAFIGAGGLGQFINEGLALLNTRLLLLGAVPSALLALVVYFAIGAVGWALDRRNHRGQTGGRAVARRAALVAPLLLVLVGLGALPSAGSSVRIGSKNFGEQLLLGEMMALLIEERTDLTVSRQYNLGGSMICHHALVQGELDIYPEYTGTGLVTVLEQPSRTDPDRTLRIVRREYAARHGLVWLRPFGFNNTYAITVRRSDARKHGWRKISDLARSASGLTPGFTDEFSKRKDGYPGLSKAYGLEFKPVKNLSPTLMYEAIKNGEVDVICAFATDGRIAAYDLVVLEDDRRFFPPYHAAPVVRRELLDRHPALRGVLEKLAGRLDDPTMQRLNFMIDSEKQDPREVARRFLLERRLITRR